MQTVAIRLQVVSATCIELEMDILGNTAETQLRLTKHIPESSPDLVDIDIEAAAGKIIYGGGLVLGHDEYCIANRSPYPQPKSVAIIVRSGARPFQLELGIGAVIAIPITTRDGKRP